MILASALSASLVSRQMHHIYEIEDGFWYLPLIFSFLPMIGFLRKNSPVIDFGIILTIIPYFFINREVPLSIINAITIVGFLFLFIGIWFFMRYFLLVGKIEDSSRKGSIGKIDISFSKPARKFTVYGILSNILLGAFLSVVASLMGSHISLARITTGRIETFLMIVFNLALFFVIYKMISIIISEEE